VNRYSLPLLAAMAGCAHQNIAGAVLDRNGAPVPGAIVSIEPGLDNSAEAASVGSVEVVTDADGRWSIDYLRNELGERVRLARRTTYRIEAFRVGFHVEDAEFDYRRGEVEVAPLTLTADTIRVSAPEDDIDPGRFNRPSQATGATFEGE
jgi:hypothetical protein